MAAGEIELAVNMHKANKMWLPMLKLVQQHRREQLPHMHLLVAHVSGRRTGTGKACAHSMWPHPGF